VQDEPTSQTSCGDSASRSAPDAKATSLPAVRVGTCCKSGGCLQAYVDLLEENLFLQAKRLQTADTR
jgi:hypothetical protein